MVRQPGGTSPAAPLSKSSLIIRSPPPELLDELELDELLELDDELELDELVELDELLELEELDEELEELELLVLPVPPQAESNKAKDKATALPRMWRCDIKIPHYDCGAQ